MATTAPSRPRPRGGLDPARADIHRGWLRQMLLIRRFEEKAGEAYSLGKIGGFCHLYIGQEAVAVGSLAALGPDDYITCSHAWYEDRVSGLDCTCAKPMASPRSRSSANSSGV